MTTEPMARVGGRPPTLNEIRDEEAGISFTVLLPADQVAQICALRYGVDGFERLKAGHMNRAVVEHLAIAARRVNLDRVALADHVASAFAEADHNWPEPNPDDLVEADDQYSVAAAMATETAAHDDTEWPSEDA